jgi:hypothetical protein
MLAIKIHIAPLLGVPLAQVMNEIRMWLDRETIRPSTGFSPPLLMRASASRLALKEDDAQRFRQRFAYAKTNP